MRSEWQLWRSVSLAGSILGLLVALLAAHLDWETVTQISLSIAAVFASQIELARRGLNQAKQLEELAHVNKVLHETIRKM